MIKIIIAGSREFNNFDILDKESVKIIKQFKSEGYNTSRSNITIVSGTARGADRLGEEFAHHYGLYLHQFPAQWNLHGRVAGYIRNKDMTRYASDSELGILIAFWDGTSKGTKHMIDLANQFELKVFVVKYNEL